MGTSTYRRDADAAHPETVEDEISIFALALVLLQHRWRIFRWAVLGGALAVVPVFLLDRTWTTTSSFVTQGADADPSGLQSLAGQFGVSIPGGTPTTQSPEFYERLLSTAVILGPIADDSVNVAELGDVRRAIVDLFEIEAPTPAWRREDAMRELARSIRTQVSTQTGMLTLDVRTTWPSVSLAISERLLTQLNRFNLQSRQSQAAEERRFVERRLAAQRRTLVDAEAQLSDFLQANRLFQNSPRLSFEHDRLQREVALQQQVLVGLAQSYEEARIREVRDVPVITVIESPRLPVRPDRRGLAVRGPIGVLMGAAFGVLVAFLVELYRRRRAAGEVEAVRLDALLSGLRAKLVPWSRRAGRVGAGPE